MIAAYIVRPISHGIRKKRTAKVGASTVVSTRSSLASAVSFVSGIEKKSTVSVVDDSSSQIESTVEGDEEEGGDSESEPANAAQMELYG